MNNVPTIRIEDILGQGKTKLLSDRQPVVYFIKNYKKKIFEKYKTLDRHVLTRLLISDTSIWLLMLDIGVRLESNL